MFVSHFMSRSRLLPLIAALACGGLSSCAWLGFGPKETPPEDPNVPKLVGRIASVPVDRRFVLIQSYGKWTTAPGTVLTTRGADERTANLLATGETSGYFAAADVQSGTVAEGDAVYSVASAEPKSTRSPEDSVPVKPPPVANPPPKKSEPIENKGSGIF